MVADQPLVVYPKDKKKELKTSKGMDEFYDKWKAKKKSLASTHKKGEKISLNDYLDNNI